MKALTLARIKLNTGLHKQRANDAKRRLNAQQEDDYWEGFDDDDSDDDDFSRLSRVEKLRYLNTDNMNLRSHLIDVEQAAARNLRLLYIQGTAIIVLGVSALSLGYALLNVAAKC